MRSGSGAATGFNNTRLTTEKMAVLVPMPRVSAARAVRVKAGLRRKVRKEWRRSARKGGIILRLDEEGEDLIVVSLRLNLADLSLGFPFWDILDPDGSAEQKS